MEYKTASIEELQKFAGDKRQELRGLRFSSAGSKNRNVKLTASIRKDVARALTEISARKLSPSA